MCRGGHMDHVQIFPKPETYSVHIPVCQGCSKAVAVGTNNLCQDCNDMDECEIQNAEARITYLANL